MCDFFSFVWDGDARFLYTTRADRSMWDYSSGITPDSHTDILTRAGIPTRDHDKWSKYEAVYNDGTGKFAFCVDDNTPGHDVRVAKAWWESWTREEFIRRVGMSGYCTQWAQKYTQWAQEHTQWAQKYTQWAQEHTQWAPKSTQRAQEYTQWAQWAQEYTQRAQEYTQRAQEYTTYAKKWRKIEEAL